MQLALTDLFRARWSANIHEEWMRNVMRDRPDLSREKLERTRTLMDKHVRDCVVTGFESLIDGLTLPDENDRHVLAAAIRCRASVIVTFNESDFPYDILDPFGIEAQHPDEFVSHLLDLSPATVYTAVKRQRKNLKRPAKTVEEFLDVLSRQQLPQTVSQLRQFAKLI